jgi:hypothetical protein
MENQKPTLKLNKVTLIEENEFSDFVSEVYGRPYRYQQTEGCLEKGTVKFSVPYERYFKPDYKENVNDSGNINKPVRFREWLSRDPKEKPPVGLFNGDSYWYISLFWNRHFYPYFGDLIDDLHKKGYVEEGEYILRIDW